MWELQRGAGGPVVGAMPKLELAFGAPLLDLSWEDVRQMGLHAVVMVTGSTNHERPWTVGWPIFRDG